MRAVALVLLLTAAGARAEDVSGRVFEVADARRVPSAGAFVIVHWTGYRPGFGHYESVCLQAAIGRTGADGRFTIPVPPMRPKFVLFRDEPAIAIYKPGFQAADAPRPRNKPEWSLVPSRMTPEQRAVYVDIFRGYGCRDDDGGGLLPLVDPQGVLGEFNRALASELPPPKPEKWEVRILRRPAPNPAGR